MTPGELLDLQRRLYEYLARPSEAACQEFDRLMFSLREILRRGEEDPLNFIRYSLISWFYPCDRGRDLLPLLRKSLYETPCYIVTPQIVDAVTGMYRKTYETQEVLLTASTLPSPSGFLWLDKPVVLNDVSGDPLSTRAISWSPARFPDGLGSVPHGDGIRWSAWCMAGDEHIQETDVLDGAPLRLSSSQLAAFGRTLHRMDMLLIDGELVPAEPGYSPDDLLYWLQTLWMFMGTEIVATERAEVTRPFRRRAERVLNHSRVNVVQLRRVTYAGREHGHRHVDWTCCWVVQEFWRHLEDYAGITSSHQAKVDPDYPGLCAVCAARITHVKTHVRGPRGLPLKVVPETVFVVER